MNKSMLFAGLLALLSTATNYAAHSPNPSEGVSAHDNSKTIAIQPIPENINCNYHLSPQTTHIDKSLIMKWAAKAAVQSFDFDHNTMDAQLNILKACYTDQGWKGFNEALEKSGNLSAIKLQKFIVSGAVNGSIQIAEIKDGQWKLNIPLQVTYQNDKQKLVQALMVTLMIGRKPSGDLGIMQVIAVPQKTAVSTKATIVPASSSPQPVIIKKQ